MCRPVVIERDDLSEPFGFPAISVVIPCFNAERFLASSLASVQQQSLRAVEMLVVDDSSTDRSVEIAREWQAIIVQNRGPKGPSGARNTGIHLARGAFVAFLDADDRWTADHLEQLVKCQIRHSADLVSSGARPLGVENLGKEPSLEDKVLSIDDLLAGNPITQSAVLARRSALLEAHGYDAGMRHAEDYDLWLRLKMRGNVMVRSASVTCERRRHAGQASNAIGEMISAAWSSRMRQCLGVGVSPTQYERYIAAVQPAFLQDLAFAWYHGDRAARATLRRVSADHPALQEALHLFESQNWAWPLARVLSVVRVAMGRSLPTSS